MVDVTLDKLDERLLEIHGALYPLAVYGTTGATWYVKSPDGESGFPTYKSFIKFIEEETKEALLRYAFNGELGELKEV